MFRIEVAPGIEIRLWSPDDAETCFAAVERNRESLRQWLPWVDRTHTAADTRAYIETIALAEFEATQAPNCGIWLKGELAGAIGVHAIDWVNRQCSIGYWLDARHRGNGLMTRCCAAMLDHLFGELDLHRVTIRCATGNTRSCAIPQRLGFRREGLERGAELVGGRWLDLWLWAILAEEWRESRLLWCE